MTHIKDRLALNFGRLNFERMSLIQSWAGFEGIYWRDGAPLVYWPDLMKDVDF
jgi:hypothetical protein